MKEFESVKQYGIVFLIIFSLFSLNIMPVNTSNLQKHGTHTAEFSLMGINLQMGFLSHAL